MARTIASLCVYCGASPGLRPDYIELADSVGAMLAHEGVRLVYGGGRVGLMGAVADGALRAGGEVVGVIPEALMVKELGHPGIQTLHVVTTMHERKAMMARLADAFIALPGGWGTMEEFTETLTWLQLGFHGKPIGLVNALGYFNHLLAFADHMVNEGFVRADHRRLIHVHTDPKALLLALASDDSTPPDRWGHRTAPPPDTAR